LATGDAMKAVLINANGVYEIYEDSEVKVIKKATRVSINEKGELIPSDFRVVRVEKKGIG